MIRTIRMTAMTTVSRSDLPTPMTDTPDPDEYDVEEQKFRGEMVIVSEYPNTPFEIHVEKDGLYNNLNRKRKKEYDYDECPNCSDEVGLTETYPACNDCYQASLDAIEEWAEEHVDDILGDLI